MAATEDMVVAVGTEMAAQASYQVEAEDAFDPIDRLQTVGVSATDVKKLVAGGYATVQSVLMSTMRDLCEVKGVSEAKALKIVEGAAMLCEKGTAFVSGKAALEAREHVVRISTGSSALDTLLGGGVETMSITEASRTLCVTSQLPLEAGGGGGKVLYIDTEGTFRPGRIVQIAERYGLDSNDVLENILTVRVYTHEQQYNMLVRAAALMADDGCIRMLIVDSITALFRVDYTGRGQLAERQQKLNQMLARLTKLADEFNIAVFITNQVVSDPGGGAMFVSDPKKPVGGHVLAHASTTRLSLRKGRGNQRVCKLFDSPCLPDAEAVYEIGPGGVSDPLD
ncbi:RAD51/dmc1 protein [Thecamonas trahens ATCC 50062]|uniref:RAD51/dmc1 protein n=1 Tax=Thecamonas trahens ATCC 50062 TaxID=461836 RepID=A0A0L0DE86_THETB|nr:RAD51/dmc1 protein [Thecamonas trahens ATCC 50062]KNC50599.1 RAD51/dmc1 protein [Thecamonas trahens ATCC 50062]|eukprot:XP_013762486.1 RAD51/dmc1 protein [Thecamonas trahens ATCC 50062]